LEPAGEPTPTGMSRYLSQAARVHSSLLRRTSRGLRPTAAIRS